MRKYVLGLILIVLLTPRLLISLGQRPRFEKVVELEQVVHLLTESSSCSGFIAAKDTIVTAAHCVDKAARAQIAVFSDNSRVTYTTLAYGSQTAGQDYAILKASTGTRKFFHFSQNALHPMQPVALIGHSEGENKQYFVMGMYLRTDGWEVYGLLAYPGDSGSAVVNSDMEVVSVLYGGYNPIPTSVGTPISVVAEQMARLGIRQ